MILGWKLFRRRKDGTLGPLFINRRLRVLVGEWMEAEAHRTPGYAFRPGWHATLRPFAPHLRTTGDRVWCKVSLEDVSYYNRPESQGGTWVLAQQLRVDEQCYNERCAVQRECTRLTKAIKAATSPEEAAKLFAERRLLNAPYNDVVGKIRLLKAIS